MSASRHFFSDTEKSCLQNLVLKYNFHTPEATVSEKRNGWALVTEEYNSIPSNSYRTEKQLKKLYDNIKSRRKKMVSKDGGSTAGDASTRVDSITSEDPGFMDDPLVENNGDMKNNFHGFDISVTKDDDPNYEVEYYTNRQHEREEELHRLRVSELQWRVKAAENAYKKSRFESESAKEIMRLNKIKRLEAEVALQMANKK